MKKHAYTLCFFFLCIINFACGALTGRLQFIAVNCEGFALAILILSKYKFKDFMRPIYLIWTCISVIAGSVANVWGIKNYPYVGRWITAVLNVIVYGFIVIRLIISIVEKKKLSINVYSFSIWVLLTLAMIISRNSRIWPAWYGIIFGCFYLTEYDQDDIKDILNGLVNGVIISFFVIQSFAFAFRPYDEYRYLGAFANPNLNALFYIMVYAALLCKLLACIKSKKNTMLKSLWFLLSCSMFGFITLCGSRTSYIAFGAVTVAFLICLYRVEKRAIKVFFGIPVLMILIAIISIGIDWLAARYLPTVHLHPIYWEGEWKNSKIQPGDPANSPKYIELGEMLRINVGRIAWFIDFDEVFPEEESSLTVYSDEEETEVIDEGPVPYNEDELLEKEGESVGPMGLRFRLAKWYFSHLNVRGHDTDEEGVWYSKDYYAPHAHNWLIMMSYSYGIPAGILYAIMMVFYVIAYIKLLFKDNQEAAAIIGCFMSGFFFFGLFETTWSQGQFPFILFFVLYKLIVDSEYVWKKENE